LKSNVMEVCPVYSVYPVCPVKSAHPR